MAVDGMAFTTQLSNGETVPVCKGGEDRHLTWDNLDEYVNLVLKARENECSKQMNALKEGFNYIFPSKLLFLLSWHDLEERVRGVTEITAAALQNVASYRNYDKKQ